MKRILSQTLIEMIGIMIHPRGLQWKYEVDGTQIR